MDERWHELLKADAAGIQTGEGTATRYSVEERTASTAEERADGHPKTAHTQREGYLPGIQATLLQSDGHALPADSLSTGGTSNKARARTGKL